MSSMLRAMKAAKRPVALTGAGISAPSGVPTFQTHWKGRPVRDFLGRDYYEEDIAGFFELYCFMEKWCDALPNAAHFALSDRNVPVITQNIDGLHQKAGSGNVIELHGNLRHVVCRRCGNTLAANTFCGNLRPLYAAGDVREIESRLHCACGAKWDVDVVLYGDAVRGMEDAISLIKACDLLLVIGTSLQTYPAAMLPDAAKRNGAVVMLEDMDCIAALTESEEK